MPGPASHCQGWLLCSDGARQAKCTAFLMISAFAVVATMATSDLYRRSIVLRYRPATTGPLVLDPARSGPMRSIRGLMALKDPGGRCLA